MTEAPSEATSGAPLEVEIDELTLHGFDPRHGGAIGEALQNEIAEALAGWRPTSASGGQSGTVETAAIDAGAVRVPAGAAPRQVGRAVGARVARALRDSDEDEAGADGTGSDGAGSDGSGTGEGQARE